MYVRMDGERIGLDGVERVRITFDNGWRITVDKEETLVLVGPAPDGAVRKRTLTEWLALVEEK